MHDIHVTGSLALDYILQVQAPLRDDRNFLASTMTKTYGGTAGNIAYGLSMLFNLFRKGELDFDYSLHGALGKDGSEYLARLRNQHDNLNIHICDMHYTAQAHIVNGNCGNQITIFHPGAMINSPNIPHSSNLTESDLVIISPNDLVSMRNYERFLEHKRASFVFDPGQMMPLLNDSALITFISSPMCKIVIVNEHECVQMLEKLSLSSAVEVAESFNRIVIVTAGDKGVTVYRPGTIAYKRAAEPISKCVDTTGCGDALRAGLLFGLQYLATNFAGSRLYDNVCQAVKLGTILAAKNAQHFGPQNYSLFNLDKNKVSDILCAAAAR